jgi:putative PIN family toxin of toxin-antitoxin system
MKVVLDSNVIIAAFATRGLSNALFELCLDRHTIITSEFILDEVHRAFHQKLRMPLPLINKIENT